MRARLTILGVVAVAIVLAVQLLWRDAAPPRVPQPAVDVAPPRAQRSAESALREQQAEVVARDAGREPAAGASRGAPASSGAPTSADGSRRFVFDCGDGVVFAVRTAAGEATLSSAKALGAEVVTLPQVEAASGARYAEGGVSYWSRGGLASFEIRDRLYADCTSSPGAAETAEARRRRTTFRASGNGPPWSLEIRPERFELAVGTRQVEFPYRSPTVAGTRTTYRTFSGTQELNVLIDRTPCNDSATGEAFDATVTVLFENQTLYGCGREP